MEFILASTCIEKIIDLSDSHAIKEKLSQLVQLEEDRFFADFVNKFRRKERKNDMINTLKIRSSKWEN